MKHLLDFEKPYIDLQRQLDELRGQPQETDVALDFDDEIRQLEEKIEAKKRELYSNLSAWQRVQLARHPQRPYSLDYINKTFNGFSELHGDRLFHDDHAIVAGFAMLGERRVMVVGTQKGRDTKENIKRNFGCAHPEGYRKALRIMGMANRFGLPIVCLIDTAGAYPGVAAEERHIAKAIAINLREMALFSVPMISVVIGEGGSGGSSSYCCWSRVARSACMSEISEADGKGSALRPGSRAGEAGAGGGGVAAAGAARRFRTITSTMVPLA